MKANQRGYGRQLVAHLLNAHDNETVEFNSVRGAVAQDLAGAIDEWHAQSKATRCRKFLYHLSINPDPKTGPLTRAQYDEFIARVETKLGLKDQPRAIVFHIKDDREHCHVAWSRIHPTELKAIPISHDRKTLQSIIRRFARDHDRPLPGNDTGKAPPPPVNLDEKHQEERTGYTKEERIALLTRLWEHTTDGPTFIKALAQKGYHLARGEKVPYAVVDPFGEIHSLPRQIQGIRTKDIRMRLKPLPVTGLPPATEVRQKVLNQIPTPTTNIFNVKAKASWTNLKETQHRRRASFKVKTEKLRTHHRETRTQLIADQKTTYRQHQEDRLHRQFGPLTPYVMKIPGINTLITNYNRAQDKTLLQQNRLDRQNLTRHQKQEWEDHTRQARAITRVEKRERRSLKTKLRREYLQATVTPEPVAVTKTTQKSGGLSPTFNRQATPPENQDTIRDTFNDQAAPPPEDFGTTHHQRLALG